VLGDLKENMSRLIKKVLMLTHRTVTSLILSTLPASPISPPSLPMAPETLISFSSRQATSSGTPPSLQGPLQGKDVLVLFFKPPLDTSNTSQKTLLSTPARRIESMTS